MIDKSSWVFLYYCGVSSPRKITLLGDISWILTYDSGRGRTEKDDSLVWDFFIWRHSFLLFHTFISSFSYFYVIVFLLFVGISGANSCCMRTSFFEKLFIKITYQSYLFIYIFHLLFNGWVGYPAKYISGDKTVYVLSFDWEKIFRTVPLKNVSANAIFTWTAVRNLYNIVVHNSRFPVINCYKIVDFFKMEF